MKCEIKSREKSAENSAEKGYFRVGMYSDSGAIDFHISANLIEI